MAKKKTTSTKTKPSVPRRIKKQPEPPLRAFRKTMIDGEIYKIGDLLPKGVKPDRNFAPDVIAGSRLAREQFKRAKQ